MQGNNGTFDTNADLRFLQDCKDASVQQAFNLKQAEQWS